LLKTLTRALEKIHTRTTSTADSDRCESRPPARRP
jgi:hypothetical protein